MRFGFPTGKLSSTLTLNGAIRRNYRVSQDWVELSVLRPEELDQFIIDAKERDLCFSGRTSFHAPAHYKPEAERSIVSTLKSNLPEGWNVILHPDSIHDLSLWECFGSRLLLENMDHRKKLGQRVHHLQEMFKELPQARFCFDIGHARQVDSSMEEAIQLHETFFDKIDEIHMSVVDQFGHHQHLDRSALLDFRKVLRSRDHMLTPVVLEVPLDDELAMKSDLTQAREAFAHAI